MILQVSRLERLSLNKKIYFFALPFDIFFVTSLVKNQCLPFIQSSSLPAQKKKNKPKRTTKNLVSGEILEQGFFNGKKRRETQKKP